MDEIPLEGINPLNEPPPPAAAGLPSSSSGSADSKGRPLLLQNSSGVSPPHSSTQDSVPIIIEDDDDSPSPRSKGQMQKQPSYEKGQQKSLSKSRSPGGVGASSSRGAKYYESSQKSHSKSRSPRSSRNKYYDFVIQIFWGRAADLIGHMRIGARPACVISYLKISKFFVIKFWGIFILLS